MVIDNRDKYLELVSNDYETLKQGIDAESKKRFSRDIDEDIYHDTILKCVEKVKNSELTIKQLENYIFVSYFNNINREKLYARNLYRSDSEITEVNGGVYNEGIDYKLIIEQIENEFGKEDCEKFLKWTDGASVREINEKYSTKNFRYTLAKIRNRLKDIL